MFIYSSRRRTRATDSGVFSLNTRISALFRTTMALAMSTSMSSTQALRVQTYVLCARRAIARARRRHRRRWRRRTPIDLEKAHKVLSTWITLACAARDSRDGIDRVIPIMRPYSDRMCAHESDVSHTERAVRRRRRARDARLRFAPPPTTRRERHFSSRAKVRNPLAWLKSCVKNAQRRRRCSTRRAKCSGMICSTSA